MKKQEKALEDYTYVRTLKAEKDGKLVTSFVAQAYCVGMYVCAEPGTVQLSIPNKKYADWVKKAVKTMEKDGLTVTTTESTYVGHLSERDFREYVYSDLKKQYV